MTAPLVTTDRIRIGLALGAAQDVRVQYQPGPVPIIVIVSATYIEPMIPIPLTYPELPSATGARFSDLAAQWHRETDHLSTMTDIILHPAFLQIIGMGEIALPFILKELEETRSGHWFTALESIAGERIATDEMSYDEAVRAWLQWGHQRGYVGVVTT